MLNNKISAMVIAGLMAASAVAVVAQDAFVAPATPEEALALRKDIMRSGGSILRSAGNLTGDQAVAAMQTLKDNYTNIPASFPEGSIVGDSKALPAIWQNWDAFVAIARTGEDAAAAELAAAQAGDAAAYAAALQTLQGTCGQCHQQFRG